LLKLLYKIWVDVDENYVFSGTKFFIFGFLRIRRLSRELEMIEMTDTSFTGLINKHRELILTMSIRFNNIWCMFLSLTMNLLNSIA